MVQRSSMITGKNARVPPFYDAQEDGLLPQPLIENNILYCPDDPSIADMALARSRALGHDRYSVAADPMFVDPQNGDFRFKDGSPALKLGIKPLEKYGIQEPCGLQKGYGHLDPGGSDSVARTARRELAEKASQTASLKRDLVLSATAPRAITPEGTIDVVAKYDVSEERDVYVVFLQSGYRYGHARQTVEAGKGDVKLTMALDEYPAEKGDDFMFVVMVLPVSETWNEALHVYRITGVAVE